VQQQQGLNHVRVKTSSADLKVQAYNQAKTVRLLSEGDRLIVLVETPAWLRVQTAGGEPGWVYRLMMEVSP
jgi:SH3-like domain-containing protein